MSKGNKVYTIEDYELKDKYIFINYHREDWAENKFFMICKSSFEYWLVLHNLLDLVCEDGKVYGQYTIDTDEYSYYDASINSRIKQDLYDYMFTNYWVSREAREAFLSKCQHRVMAVHQKLAS